jgi:hypothetical protein
MGAPDRLNVIWYQSFNQMDLAPSLVGASRGTCEIYISHFLRHWSHRKQAFDDVLSRFIDNFMKPEIWWAASPTVERRMPVASP